MATTPYNFPHPSVTTYPPFPYPAPTQIHGHLHHTPFPFFPTPTYSPFTPATIDAGTAATGLPYASPFPYPHPQDLWSTPSIFVPPPTSPPPALPYAAPLPYFSTPNKGNDNGPFPPNATAEIRPSSTTSVLHRATPYSMCQGGYLTEVNGAGGESISDETFVRKHTDGSLSMPNTVPDPSFITLQGTTASTPSVGFGITSTPAASGASTGPAVLGSTTAAPLVGNTTTSPAATTSPTTTPSAEARVPAEASISKNMPCAILDLKRRLDEQQARDRTSFDKLRGELAKLTSMATQLAISIGKQSSAAESSSTTAYVAQHVFDKMPTPNSGFEDCSAHPNQIQSSCVQGGSTNLREKNIEELPQAYGPHNLICRTVVRADGTEHSYYALPEDYSLKQATPLVSPTAAEHVGAKAPQFVAAQTAGQVPVCLSKANNTAGSDSPLIPSLQLPMNVQEASLVLKQMPVYGLDEEDISCLNCMDKQLDRVFHKASDNAFSEQIRRCFSKVQKTERTNANVAVYALEQEHNGETTSVNVQQLKDPQLNVLEILERRKEWDPGALLLLMSSRTQHYSCPAKLNGGEKLSLAKQDKEQLLKCFNKVSACQDVPDVYERRTCQKESEGDDKLCWEKSICRTATELPISYFPWDPGASTSFYSSKAELLGNQVETHVQQLRNPCWNVLVASEKREWDPGDTTFYALFTTADSATKLQRTNVYKPAVVQILDVQFGVRRALIFKSAVMRCDAFGLARTKVNGSALFVLVVPGSTDTSCSSPSFENMAKLLWDPGIGISCYMYLWPEMRAVKMLGKTAVPNLVHSGQTPCNLRNFLGHPVDLKQIEAYCPSNIGFVLQQGVHENYSAKQLLLYSQKYLQIKEMDIIFITHLPP